MKKFIFISAVIILLGLAGYVFVVKKSVKRESVEQAPQKAAEAPAQTSPAPSPAATIDTNDNLDQALQDLDQIE
jgi:flagellar basal body-associated protein FliL